MVYLGMSVFHYFLPVILDWSSLSPSCACLVACRIQRRRQNSQTGCLNAPIVPILARISWFLLLNVFSSQTALGTSLSTRILRMIQWKDLCTLLTNFDQNSLSPGSNSNRTLDLHLNFRPIWTYAIAGNSHSQIFQQYLVGCLTPSSLPCNNG